MRVLTAEHAETAEISNLFSAFSALSAVKCLYRPLRVSFSPPGPGSEEQRRVGPR